MLSHVGTFLIGFGTAWFVGLVAASDDCRRRGGRLADSDILVPLLTPALVIAAGTGLITWS